MIKKQYHVTKEGLNDLKTELDKLVAMRSQIAQDIASARSQGDLSENAEYHEAKEEQARNEARIEEIENIIASADIITTPKNDSKVRLGSKVKLKESSGSTKEFQVVGTVEADPLNGKISDESPIGQALIGKKEGEEVQVGPTAYTVASIS